MRTAGKTLCRYQTDADGHLVHVDQGWCDFALANDAAEYAVPDALYGRALLSFISEPTTQHVYSVLMNRVQNQHAVVVVPFRCDAPQLRRWLELKMTPHEGGVAFATRELRTEQREAPFPFGRAGSRADLLLRMCSWCKDVEAQPGRWERIEDAVSHFALFREPEVPGITHGICPSCVALFERDPRR